MVKTGSIPLREHRDTVAGSHHNDVTHVAEQANLDHTGQRQQGCFHLDWVGDGRTGVGVGDVIPLSVVSNASPDCRITTSHPNTLAMARRVVL